MISRKRIRLEIAAAIQDEETNLKSWDDLADYMKDYTVSVAYRTPLMEEMSNQLRDVVSSNWHAEIKIKIIEEILEDYQ